MCLQFLFIYLFFSSVFHLLISTHVPTTNFNHPTYQGALERLQDHKAGILRSHELKSPNSQVSIHKTEYRYDSPLTNERPLKGGYFMGYDHISRLRNGKRINQ